MEKLKPRLLVVGGTGFIGYHLLKAALEKNFELSSVSIHPPTTERFLEGVQYINVDLCNLKKSMALLEKREFEYVVNLGGYIDHKLFSEGGQKNIEKHFGSLQNLVATLSRSSIQRFVQIGSSDEYGNATAPQHEELRECPISPYSLAKVASTHFLQMLNRTENFPAVILRLFLTYGPNQNIDRFLPQIIHGCIENTVFPTTEGEQLRDFCYVGDTVKAIFQALTVPDIQGMVINVASGTPVSIRNVIERVCEILGSGQPRFGEISYRPSENMELYATIEKASKILQWQPLVSLETGLRNTIKWYDPHQTR